MNNLPSILSLLHPYVGDERENLQVWSTRVKVTQSAVVCSVCLPAQGKRGRNLVWEFSLKVEPQNPTQIKSRCLCTLAFTFGELSIDGTAAVETFLFGFSNLALQKDKQTRWLYESCSMKNIKNWTKYTARDSSNESQKEKGSSGLNSVLRDHVM